MKKRVLHRPERDRTVFEVLHAIKGKTAAEVARETYVSASTIRNWRRPNETGTRYPQHCTLAAVARTQGLVFKLVRTNE